MRGQLPADVLLPTHPPGTLWGTPLTPRATPVSEGGFPSALPVQALEGTHKGMPLHRAKSSPGPAA